MTRISSLLAATALCGAAFPALPALAQTQAPARSKEASREAADTVGDAEIIVSGTRAALDEGALRKKNSVQFVESVVAEDIGKLPDNNVAESLQRVPGVQVVQGIGEGTSITVRGSRDNVYLLNGRPLVDVAGRGGTGLDTLGTSTYGVLSVIPAELIRRLDVTKLPGADEIEGALGGTVDILTRRPLDRKGQLLSGSIEWNRRELGDTDGARASLLASATNSDQTFGALFNVVYSRSDVQQESFASFAGYGNVSDVFNNNRQLFPAGRPDPLARYRIADLRYQALSDKRDRLGASVTLQWRPADTLDIYLDSSFGLTKSDRVRDWIAVPVSNSAPDYRSITISPDGYIVGGEIGLTPPATNLSVRPSLNREFAILDSRLSSTALGGTWQSGRWTLFGEAAYTIAQSSIHQVATILAPQAPTPFRFAYNGAGEIPTLDLASAGLTDPTKLVWQGIQDNRRTSKTDDIALRFDADYEVGSGLISSIEAGSRYETLSYRFTPRNRGISSTVGQPATGLNVLASTTPGLIEQFNNPSFLAGTDFPRAYTTSSRAILEKGCENFLSSLTQAQKDVCLSTTPTFDQVSGVDEKIFAAYAKLNFDTEIGVVDIRGNVGARYVRDSRRSTGYIQFNNFVPTVPGGTTGTVVREFKPNEVRYQDEHLLPSAVIRASFPHDIVLRAGAARVIARPATSLLNAGFTITEPTTPNGTFSGSGGNPKLKPYLVDQFDVAAEWYFAKGGLLSAAAFYKDVKTYFVRQTRAEIVPGYNNDQPINVSRTQNYEDGTIKGLELIYQQQYDFLPGFLKGLGSQVSFSIIDSKTPTIDPVTKTNLPLPGLSKYSYNAVLYYEDKKFGVRVGYNWRDKYFDSIASNNSGVYFKSFSSLTASMRYSITSNTRITVSANNIGAKPQIKYNAKPEYIQSYDMNGATFNVSLSKVW